MLFSHVDLPYIMTNCCIQCSWYVTRQFFGHALLFSHPWEVPLVVTSDRDQGTPIKLPVSKLATIQHLKKAGQLLGDKHEPLKLL